MMLNNFKMSSGLAEFTLLRGDGTLTFDFEKIAELSDSEFLRRHIQDMNIHLRNHGGIFLCRGCELPIEDAKDLIRYYGENYHVACLKPVYKHERVTLEKNHQNYFDRILRLKSS